MRPAPAKCPAGSRIASARESCQALLVVVCRMHRLRADPRGRYRLSCIPSCCSIWVAGLAEPTLRGADTPLSVTPSLTLQCKCTRTNRSLRSHRCCRSRINPRTQNRRLGSTPETCQGERASAGRRTLGDLAPLCPYCACFLHGRRRAPRPTKVRPTRPLRHAIEEGWRGAEITGRGPAVFFVAPTHQHSAEQTARIQLVACSTRIPCVDTPGLLCGSARLRVRARQN